MSGREPHERSLPRRRSRARVGCDRERLRRHLRRTGAASLGGGIGAPRGPGLYGLSAYDAGDHWHFVTLGLSELWTKESEDPEVSGFGYELTMRTSHRGEGPPDWTINLLNRLAELVFQGTDLGPGHTLDPGGSITGESTSDLTGLAFVPDPQLGSISTPNGSLHFVQVVVSPFVLHFLQVLTPSVTTGAGHAAVPVTATP